ncbi:MAG: radical SAM protein, partial [Patescibacteria group bacterium]
FLDHGFDISVVGEGEQTALEIAEHVNNQDMDWSKINGIVYRNSNNEIIQNPPREYLDISNLPLPAYNKVDMKGYVGMWDGIIRGLPLRGALIMSSRGCPYACTFCDCNKVFGQHVRYRSLENIEQEVQLLKQTYGVEGIWLADDTFTLNKEHILGVGKIMKKHKMIWGCQARVNLVDEKLIKTMKKLGCIQFDLGVESGSQRVLDEVMNKKTNLDQVRQAFRLCHKYKIRTLANLMMGLPTESKEEMEQTMDLAREIKANFYVFSIFTPLPGTTLFDKYYKNEIDYRDYKELNFFAGIERFNKSKVKDLKTLNTEWRKELAMRMKKSNLTLHYVFLYLKIFFKLKHKKKRLQFVLKKVLNLIRK